MMPPVAASKKIIQFDPKTFLSTIEGGGRKVAAFSKKQTIFVQGDSSDAVFCIQTGKVKLTVVSKIGKEATIGILNEGDFFGEGCLTGQRLRLCSATAMTEGNHSPLEKYNDDFESRMAAWPISSLVEDLAGTWLADLLDKTQTSGKVSVMFRIGKDGKRT